MARVVVVHFNPPNLDKRLARLAQHQVETVVPNGPADLKPLEKPVVPSTMDAYSQTQLEPNLGVRDSTTMLLVGAPEGFGKALRRAEFVEEGPAKIVMLFSDSAALADAFEGAEAAIAAGGSL
jgi:hypothetical protein